jgi:hypothetical protein
MIILCILYLLYIACIQSFGSKCVIYEVEQNLHTYVCHGVFYEYLLYIVIIITTVIMIVIIIISLLRSFLRGRVFHVLLRHCAISLISP